MDENRTRTYEEILSTAEGERTFLATKGPLHDAQGQVSGIFGISRDITERHQAATMLKQQAETLSQRVSELEHFNRATVDRELTMIGLKRQVNALSVELGRTPPFDLGAFDAPEAAGRP